MFVSTILETSIAARYIPQSFEVYFLRSNRHSGDRPPRKRDGRAKIDLQCWIAGRADCHSRIDEFNCNAR